jgi:hypothetical protein
MMLAVPATLPAQTEPTPEEWILRLTYQSSARPRDPAYGTGFISSRNITRWDIENLGISLQILKSERAALPALENAVESLTEQGEASPFYPNSEWLLQVYAKIAGVTATPRLHKLGETYKYHRNIDKALALSLGITSYVDHSQVYAAVWNSVDNHTLDGAFDRFILAWYRNEPDAIAAALAPQASAAFRALLSLNSWPGPPSMDPPSKAAVGYRFTATALAIPKPLRTPHPIFEQWSFTTGSAMPAADSLETTFVNVAGQECGTHSVRFVILYNPPSGPNGYFVDNTDIGALAQFLRTCSSR